MGKLTILLAVVCAALGVFAKETVVIVPAHPDDLCPCIGFCLLAREQFDVHVIDFTHGERGLGKAAFEDGSCKRIRMAEEQAVCDAVGAKLHWLDEVDGEAYAGRETCEKLAALLKELNPRAVFAHWPVDIHGDHVMAGAAVQKAIFLAGIMPEIYFSEQGYQSKRFDPDQLLDITDVAERKYEIIRLYKCQYRDGGIERNKRAQDLVNALHSAKLSGASEGFTSFVPPQQGQKSIFQELPAPKLGKLRFQGAR